MQFRGGWRTVHHNREFRALLLLVILAVAGGLIEPRLLSPSSLNSILLWVPLLIIVACGQMAVVIQGGIDVSVGSILGLSGICIGVLFRTHPEIPLWFGFCLSILFGAIMGFGNGLAVTRLRVPPIVATLGTLSIFRGLSFIVSKGEQVDSNHLPSGLTQLALGGPLRIGGISFSWLLVIASLVAVLAFLLFHRSRFGIHSFAIGGNLESARLRSVRVARCRLIAFVICGAAAGFAGLLYAARFGFVNPASAGYGFELTAIAAVVIGGCSVRGGTGSVVGVVLGSLFLGLISTGLSVLRIEANYQLLTFGAVILLGLLVEQSFGRTKPNRAQAR